MGVGLLLLVFWDGKKQNGIKIFLKIYNFWKTSTWIRETYKNLSISQIWCSCFFPLTQIRQLEAEWLVHFWFFSGSLTRSQLHCYHFKPQIDLLLFFIHIAESLIIVQEQRSSFSRWRYKNTKQTKYLQPDLWQKISCRPLKKRFEKANIVWE